MQETAENIIPKKGVNPYLIISSILLIGVIIITGTLYLISNSLDKSIENSNLKISEYQSEIDKLKGSNEIASYDIVKSSKTDIEKTIEKSMAQKYINETINIGKKYRILLSGFSFDGENISTNATAKAKNNTTNAISITANFIKGFRENSKEMFELSPISSIAGSVLEKTFSVGFKLIK